jgi:hypothetical protein
VPKPTTPGESKEPGGQPECDEHRTWVHRGNQVGWKPYDNLYIDPANSLARVNAFAESHGEHPIPLRPKALVKRLADLGVTASSAKDRNTARVMIDGVKRDVIHIMTWKFVEFQEPAKDPFVARDEEDRLAYENYIGEQRKRDEIRKKGEQYLHELRQERLCKLLEPS